MNNKYDVGVLGVWSGCNYGSVATYYALNKVIESMGKSVLMIDKPVVVDNDVERADNHSRRFANEHYNISEQYKLNEFERLNDLCDAFVVGSDQVWNYGISKNFGKHFYLDFVNEDKKKIAYAASFGHGIDFAPEEEKKNISILMSKFDGISVRESDGVKICKNEYGINAQQVIDPVFLADTQIFEDLIVNKTVADEKEKFIATYILDPTEEKRRALLHIAEKLGGIKIVNMLDGLPWLFESNKEKMNLDNCIENLQVEDWLYYIKKAEFVITDSCHGASFALLFNKRFIAITNKRRGYSRFDSLARLFGFRDRLVTDINRIFEDDSLFDNLDYDVINNKLSEERIRCYKWLKDKLDVRKMNKKDLKLNVLPKTNNAVTSIVACEKCIGCGACVSCCPVGALDFTQNVDGYYCPKVNRKKCINCGKCIGVCPVINTPQTASESPVECYEVVNSDKEIQLASSSGGAFSVLADKILELNGAVVGAAWTNDHRVEHRLIEDSARLDELRKSKYMQSYMGKIYVEIKEHVLKGQMVLVVACPCQIAGLINYIGKDYDNLLLVDLLCGNSPSTVFFQKYVEEEFGNKLLDYTFRYKDDEYDWDSSVIKATSTDGLSEVRHGGSQDNYQRVYHNHTMCPSHCENCIFQAAKRYGDITIGDFWGIGKRDLDIDYKKGVSFVGINTEKGKNFFESISEERMSVKKLAQYNWLGRNGMTRNGKNYAGSGRDDFYYAIKRMSFSKACDYALKPNHGYGNKEAHYDKLNPLQFSSKRIHFKFEEEYWEEHEAFGSTVLTVKDNNVGVGHYAVLPLIDSLKKGETYILSVRFKLRSSSGTLNFHIKDSGSKSYQVIYSYKYESSDNDKWVEKSVEFTPKSSIFDEFMFGAAQLRGSGAYLAIDYINIIKK